MEITDPATELAHLVEWLLGITNPKPISTCEAIAMTAGLASDSYEYSEIVAAVAGRTARLRTLANSLESQGRVAHTLAGQVNEALDGLTATFGLENQGKRWETLKQQYVLPAHGFALFKLGHDVRRVRPLRVIGDAERQDALKEISEAREELSKVDELDEWLRSYLLESLDRLVLVIRHIRFFGYTMFLREFSATELTVRTAIPKVTSPQALAAISLVGGALATAVALYKAPTDIRDGWPFWRDAAAPYVLDFGDIADKVRAGITSTQAVVPHLPEASGPQDEKPTK